MRKSALVAAAAIAMWMPVRAQQRPAAPAAPRPSAAAQDDSFRAASNRRADEGKGPYRTLVIRGVMLIDGTGAPPRGPVDIVVEGNRIAAVPQRRTPGTAAARESRRRRVPSIEVDATGMYVMPGFVDMHVHAGGAPKNADAEYAYKLWLAHGVTTVRGVPLARHAFTVSEKERSANATRSSRRASSTTSGRDRGWDRGRRRHARKARGSGCSGATANGIDGLKLGARTPRDHGGAARRGEEARPGIDRAPRSRAASRR